jgi:hypothetical protein
MNPKQQQLTQIDPIEKEWQARRNRASDKLAKMPINEISKSVVTRIESMLDLLDQIGK